MFFVIRTKTSVVVLIIAKKSFKSKTFSEIIHFFLNFFHFFQKKSRFFRFFPFFSQKFQFPDLLQRTCQCRVILRRNPDRKTLFFRPHPAACPQIIGEQFPAIPVLQYLLIGTARVRGIAAAAGGQILQQHIVTGLAHQIPQITPHRRCQKTPLVLTPTRSIHPVRRFRQCRQRICRNSRFRRRSTPGNPVFPAPRTALQFHFLRRSRGAPPRSERGIR